MSTPPRKPDFSNVKSSVTSTEQSSSPDVGELKPQVTYTVAKGDTLSKIAKEHYGKASKWPLIFDANRDQLNDPDRIKPGQVLKIPADAAGDA